MRTVGIAVLRRGAASSLVAGWPLYLNAWRRIRVENVERRHRAESVGV